MTTSITTIADLSSAIVDALESPAALRLLDRPETWTKGGCLLLADAMKLWLGRSARPFALLGRRRFLHKYRWRRRATGPTMAQHVLVHVRRWYLDGDGVSSKAALLRRWRDENKIVGPRLAPDPRWTMMLSFPGMYREPKTKAAALAKILERRCPRHEALATLGSS